VDRDWNVVRSNDAARVLFGAHADEGASLLSALTGGTLQTMIVNWPDVARAAAQRLRTESVARGGVGAFERAAELLSTENSAKAVSEPLAVVPTIFRVGAEHLSLFATLAQFGTPEDVTVADLRVELYFPLDARSAALLEAVGPSRSAKH
jgi:hypothetical protein